MKIDKILENYPELDSSRKAELKEELLGLFSVSGSAIDILIWLADCYYTIDEATVPKGGIDVAPQQVVGNISLNYKSYKQLRDIAEHYR